MSALACPACSTPVESGQKFCPKCGGPLAADLAPVEDAFVGKVIGGKYRIVKLLGEDWIKDSINGIWFNGYKHIE